MRWIHSRRAVVALVAAVAVLTIALGSWQSWLVQAQGDVIWVNDADDVGEPEECDTSTALASITTALGEVDEAEDIIRLCEGTYDGDVTIDESVTIEGREGADRADVVIEVEPAAPADGLVVEADDVTIRHLTLDGPTTTHVGIKMLLPGYDGLTISDVEVADWGSGILTDPARAMVIQGSHIHDCEVDGVVVWAGSGNVIRDNEITNNGVHGLVMQQEDELVVEDNTLSGNADSQVAIFAKTNVRMRRNVIETATDSNGIWIGPMPAEAFIEIGSSSENANSFTGPLGTSGYQATLTYYVYLDCEAENTVDATYNWWDVTSRADIASRIFNDEDDAGTGVDCPAAEGDGAVVFHPWATVAAPAPSPSPTPTATSSPMPSPTPSPPPTPVPATRDFDLYPGWNDFVWTGATGTAPVTVLSCIEDDYSIAYRFMESSQMFERQVPGEPMLSNMTEVDKYDNLLVHVSASGVQCLGMPVEP